jgi:hypothetical protein
MSSLRPLVHDFPDFDDALEIARLGVKPCRHLAFPFLIVRVLSSTL